MTSLKDPVKEVFTETPSEATVTESMGALETESTAIPLMVSFAAAETSGMLPANRAIKAEKTNPAFLIVDPFLLKVTYSRTITEETDLPEATLTIAQ
jgi:hypothetical protein